MCHLTQKAISTIAGSQVIVGYKTYIRLLGSLIDNKEVVSTGMTEEIERAEYAIKKTQEGKNVCIISSGDPGVYGMAGLVLELLNKMDGDIKVEIIPGIPASSSCASLLGAPLMHDFVSISLSDLLTDRGLIKKRVELAAKGDFVIVLYNPKSKKRVQPLRDACRVLMRYRSPETPVGIVRNAYRDSQEIEITSLKNMLNSGKIDMFSTVIVGNTRTYVKDGFMITPRGYNLKS